MAHIGRTVKNLEAPRPLKSQSSRSQIKNNNFMVIEELIQLIENVALSLLSGINNPEPMALLVQNLRIHGPQLETVSKDTLDRSFVTFRNASQDERLNIMTRLNLLELIELRAKGWEDNGINTYYKTKATNVEPESANIQPTMIVDQSTMMSTSPTLMMSGSAAAIAAQMQHQLQQQQQQQQQLMQQTPQQQLLAPGEIIRNSGKFTKPTKIPGKNYCKDEVVIRNADSGKVNPGAKERLVQITGPSEEKINYAKQLIEDTIKRNASPVRLEPAMNAQVANSAGVGGSCSSLASSASDEVQPRGIVMPPANRSSFGGLTTSSSAGGMNQNFMIGVNSTSTPIAPTPLNHQSRPSSMRSNPTNPMLLHSFSTNDASMGEFKHTVNVGQRVLKITGDCWQLVRAAKLVLEDYFSSDEFLVSFEAGAAFDGSMNNMNSTSTPTTPGVNPFASAMGGGAHQLVSSPFADSGVGLNYMAGQFANNSIEGDDDVFVDSNSSTQHNGLARSRRSHFSRKDSTPDGVGAQNKSTSDAVNKSETVRIVHERERLVYYAKSPHSWSTPENWSDISEKYPSIIRNKVNNKNSSNFMNAPTQLHTKFTTQSANNNYNDIDDKLSTLSPLPNIVRKGFFSRSSYSIDEGSSTNNNNNNNLEELIINNNNNNEYEFKGIVSRPFLTTNRPPRLTLDNRSFSTCD